MTRLARVEAHGEAGEPHEQRPPVVADAEDAVGQAARLGVGELELPGVDGDPDGAVGLRGAEELAAVAEEDGRAARGRGRGAGEHVGPGQGGHGGVGRGAEELGRRRQLEQAAAVDHADPRGEGGCILEGVGDEQGRQAEPAELVAELVADLAAGDRVEGGEWLVEQEHARVAGQGPGQGDALALAAGELAGPRAAEVGDPEPVEQVGASPAGGEADVGGDVQVGEEPVVLGQVADPAPLGAQVGARGGVEPALAAERDPPALGALEPGDGAQERALPGAGGPDQGDGLGA